MNYNIGDIVKVPVELAPTMVVTYIDGRTEFQILTCVWFDSNDHLQEHKFLNKCVVKVENKK